MVSSFTFWKGNNVIANRAKCGIVKSWVIEDIGKIPYRADLVHDCMEYLDGYIRNHNIHVLMGFSQGGNVIDTYLRTRANNIQCAVIVSGYSFVYPAMKRLDVPLLNVYSPEDDIVRAEFRPTEYNQIQEIRHGKGHKNLTQKSVIREIMDFIATHTKLPVT